MKNEQDRDGLGRPIPNQKRNKYCGQIKVGANNYKIQMVPGLSSEGSISALGKVKHHKGLIQLGKGYSNYRRYLTLWHEIIHGISNERSLEFDEKITDQLTNALILLFQDNPQLVQMIIEERFIKNKPV